MTGVQTCALPILHGHYTELSIKPFLLAARLSAEAQGKSGIPVDTYRFHRKCMITEVELKPPYCYFDVEDNFEMEDDEFYFLPYATFDTLSQSSLPCRTDDS